MRFSVMDRSGDTKQSFDVATKTGLAEAEARFKELTGKGFAAIERGENGAPGTLLRTFNPEAKDVVFQPQLQGG